MPTVDLDFGSVGKVPEGWFRIVCDKPIYKSNKSRDGFIIEMQMRLIDMPEGFEEFENTSIRDYPSLKLAARWKLQDVLGAFTQEDWSSDGMQLEIECEEDCGADQCSHQMIVPLLKDATAVALVYSKEYEGKPRPNVTRYLPDDGTVKFGSDETE